MANPFVSICIPTYNGSPYLRECLDSVLSQTYTDFEVLLVDDQSTDMTVSIAQEYAEQDLRIRVVQNSQNLGLVGNWNRCLEMAHGEWIKFVFQDDLIAPLCLEKMLEASQPDSLIVCCLRNFIFDDSTPQDIREFYENILSLQNFFSESAEISVKDYCQVILSNIGYNFVGEPTAVMLRRNAFHRFGTFNPHLIQICDLEFWTRVAVHTGIIYIDEPLATFRLHGQSTTSKNHAGRQYRVGVLDPLVFLHDLVLHPLYAPIRAIAAAQPSPTDLTALLRQRAYQARKDAQHSPDVQEAWRKVISAYPALADFAKASVIMGFTYDATREFYALKEKTRLLVKSQIQRKLTIQQPQAEGK